MVERRAAPFSLTKGNCWVFARLARKGTGLSLIEVIVVMAVIALLSTAAYPVAQIYRQREKERRLREMLNMIRQDGVQAYRQHVLRKLAYAGLTSSQYSWAVGTGSDLGHLFPPTIASLYNPVGPLEVTIGAAATYTVQVTSRFVRPFTNNFPPHPFLSWYPAASWTYTFQAARGVKDVHSANAGYGVDGTNTDGW